jgi:hypothetical protein
MTFDHRSLAPCVELLAGVDDEDAKPGVVEDVTEARRGAERASTTSCDPAILSSGARPRPSVVVSGRVGGSCRCRTAGDLCGCASPGPTGRPASVG